MLRFLKIVIVCKVRWHNWGEPEWAPHYISPDVIIHVKKNLENSMAYHILQNFWRKKFHGLYYFSLNCETFPANDHLVDQQYKSTHLLLQKVSCEYQLVSLTGKVLPLKIFVVYGRLQHILIQFLFPQQLLYTYKCSRYVNFQGYHKYSIYISRPPALWMVKDFVSVPYSYFTHDMTKGITHYFSGTQSRSLHLTYQTCIPKNDTIIGAIMN